jgi:hypothetical protein
MAQIDRMTKEVLTSRWEATHKVLGARQLPATWRPG